MGAAGSHLLRLGPALWKFVLRCPAAIPVAYRDGFCLIGRWGQAGGVGHAQTLLGNGF